MDTFCDIDFIVIKGKPVENAVNSAQRAQVLAKWPVNEDGKQDDKDEKAYFPAEQETDGAPEAGIFGHQRETAQQGT